MEPSRHPFDFICGSQGQIQSIGGITEKYNPTVACVLDESEATLVKRAALGEVTHMKMYMVQSRHG